MERSASFWNQLLLIPELAQVLDTLGFDWVLSPKEQEDLSQLLYEVNNHPDEAQGSVVERMTEMLLHVCNRVKNSADRYLGQYYREHGELPQPNRIQEVETIIRALIQKVEISQREDSMSELFEQATKAAERAVEARDTIQVTAASVSESELAEHYSKFAEGEAKKAEWFRGFTIGLIIAGIMLAWLLLNNGTEPKDIVFRVTIIAAVFGLAGYLARQSSHHRRLAVWGDTIAVQLHTFEGYLSPINNDDMQHQLRLTFAARVFASPPESKTESSDSVPADWMASTLALLTRQNQPK